MSTDSDMDVSRKLVCQFMVLSVPRVNSISHLKITSMDLTDTECTFVFDDVLKHFRPSLKKNTSFQSIYSKSKIMSNLQINRVFRYKTVTII